MNLQLPVPNFCMLASPSREYIKVTLDYLTYRSPLPWFFFFLPPSLAVNNELPLNTLVSCL